MRKSTVRRVVACAAALALAAIGVQLTVGSQAAFAAITCSTAYANTTLAGNVTVPAGATCDLTNVTITGNLTVAGGAPGGILTINGGTINGSVTALPGAKMNVNTAFSGCSSDPTVPPCAPPIKVGGSVNMDTIRLNIPPCPNVTVGSNLTINNTDPNGGCLSVGGNTAITNNQQALAFSNSTFTGNITITGNQQPLQFGGPDSRYANTVGGSVTVRNNVLVDVENNIIHGSLLCSGNTTSFFANNTVGGTNQGVTGC